jgi:hypothetical protein
LGSAVAIPAGGEPAVAGAASSAANSTAGATQPQTAPAPLPAPEGLVGVPVRLAEPAALRLVRARDRVDLFRASDSSRPVATDAMVLGVTGLDDPLTGGLLLALNPADARSAIKQTAEGYAIMIRPSG